MRLRLVLQRVWRRSVARVVLGLLLGGGASLLAIATVRRQNARASARLDSAAERLVALTDGAPADNQRRTAIAWGYAERLRLGLESPFRLIESAASDTRLTSDERRTVAWGLLAHIARGQTHDVDAASLDLMGPWEAERSVEGEQHLVLIERAVTRADNPRSAELAVRFAYTLAAAERLVEGPAPVLAAEVAAMIADREIARREARDVLRSSGRSDPIDDVRRRRARRGFYVERPVLLSPTEAVEKAAIAMTGQLLDSLRSLRPAGATDLSAYENDPNASTFAPRLYEAGKRNPPVAPLVVTVQRYLSVVRTHAVRLDAGALARVQNGEMLVAVAQVPGAGRTQRRAMGRLLLAASVAMRSVAQQRVWNPGDPVPNAVALASTLGVADITFDRDVPATWRPYFLQSFADGLRDLRRVLPALALDAVHVRFRMSAPTDSALAMHDPRTRTLHLPVLTTGGTLTHELAHDLDRQSARLQGFAGYGSDIAARGSAKQGGRAGAASRRLAASLRALTEEIADVPRAARATPDRPAEIFATRVDWFVASALARGGVSNGFLSAVQDELLTGHVVNPERLRNSGRSRSLLAALEGMTTVAPFAIPEHTPTAQTLLRWSLASAVDRRVTADIVRGESSAWKPVSLIGTQSCADDLGGRAELVRMAAESRALGWLRLRARWTPDSIRPVWARSMLRQSPWSDESANRRIAQLRDYILVELAANAELPAGLAASAAPLVLRARCAR